MSRWVPDDVRRGVLRRGWLAGLLALGLLAPGSRPASAGEPSPSGSSEPEGDWIRVAEIVPALRGSEAGAVLVTKAPPLGGVRLVRRAEVLRALRAGGYPIQGLRIPARSRVRREARRLGREALRDALEPEVRAALSPCVLERLRVPARMLVPAGEPSLRVERLPRPRPGSRRVSGTVRWRGIHGLVRVPVTAQVRCPPPEVRPGQRVRLQVRFGAVRASVEGVARQPGRVGDVVAVHNPASGRRLRARVIGPGLLEVVR